MASGAKKLIIVPSTIARHHMPIRARRDTAFSLVLRKTFSSFTKINPAVTDVTCCDAANERVEREERTYFRCFRSPGRTSQLTRFTPPLRFVMPEMNLQPRQERSLNIWGEMHENSSHSCFLCRHRAVTNVFEGCWQSLMKITVHGGILIYLLSN